MSETSLPHGFSALEPFVARWAITDVAGRAEMRGAAPEAERTAFYAATVDRVEQGLDYLDTKSFAAYDAADNRLMSLLLAFAHVALAEEMQKEAEPEHTRLRAFMRITRAPADC